MDTICIWYYWKRMLSCITGETGNCRTPHSYIQVQTLSTVVSDLTPVMHGYIKGCNICVTSNNLLLLLDTWLTISVPETGIHILSQTENHKDVTISRGLIKKFHSPRPTNKSTPKLKQLYSAVVFKKWNFECGHVIIYAYLNWYSSFSSQLKHELMYPWPCITIVQKCKAV